MLFRSNQDIIEVNNALIAVLQDRLRIKEYNGFTTIEQEIEMIHQYSIIQQKRYNNNISFIYEISAEVSQVYIPKFILQPIVENAFNHGFVTEGYKNGEISISIYQKNDKLYLSVRDNGIGINPEKLKELNNANFTFNNGKNFGLYSINERLKFYYGESYRIKFSSDNEYGTETLIVINSFSTNKPIGRDKVNIKRM